MLDVKIPDRYAPGQQKTLVASDASRIVLGIGQQCGWDGEFFLRPIRQIKAGGSHPIIRFVDSDEEGVKVQIRPGDSGTCWEYRLSGPSTANGKWVADLRAYDGWFGKGIPASIKARNGKHREGAKSPALESSSLASQLLSLEQTAAAYRERQATITALDAEIAEYMELQEDCERRRKEAEVALAFDKAGAEAESVLQSLRAMLTATPAA